MNCRLSRILGFPRQPELPKKCPNCIELLANCHLNCPPLAMYATLFGVVLWWTPPRHRPVSTGLRGLQATGSTKPDAIAVVLGGPLGLGLGTARAAARVRRDGRHARGQAGRQAFALATPACRSGMGRGTGPAQFNMGSAIPAGRRGTNILRARAANPRDSVVPSLYKKAVAGSVV